MSLNKFLKELLSLPVKGFAKVKAATAAGVAKVRDTFTHKEGKLILKIGNTLQNTGKGNPLEINKLGSNRWTRFKRVVSFPFKYVWYGKAEL